MNLGAVNGIIVIVLVLLGCVIWVYHVTLASFKAKCKVLEEIIENRESQVRNYKEMVKAYDDRCRTADAFIEEQGKLLKSQDDYIKVLEVANGESRKEDA